jgi:eukaryotic-like serine/threonine-protein kinase
VSESAPGGCIGDELLFALATGDLEDRELARVEAHLRKCADCRTVLAEVARSLEAPDGSASPPGAPTVQIARYEVRALIGAGASGVVYRALDPNLMRIVAIKVLRPDLHASSAAFKTRMLREAQAMAQLSHPHVVAVYDVGTHEDTVYIVMEHIDGLTLSQWLQASPRSPAEILRVAIEAGRGLAAAHDKGLVHRDFKPENVLVARDGQAKVTDFGLARLGDVPIDLRELEGAAQEAATLTRGLVGTPAYMAPELFAGAPAGARSDQFAFCVTLHAALFGRHPYGAGQGLALSELIARVQGETREAPTLSSPLHEHVLDVTSRGLRADPAARHADMAAVLLALERARGVVPLQRRVSIVVVAFALLAALGSYVALRQAAPAPTLAAPATSSATFEAAALPTPTAAPSPSVVAEPMPSSSSPPPLVEPRPASPRSPAPLRKPTEVRYRDGLKEPF